MGNVPVNLAIVAGTGQRSGGPGYGSYAKGFTNPFGTVWFNDVTGAMSIYATGTSSSTPTSTPTPTPVPTSTPKTTSTPTPIPIPAPTDVSSPSTNLAPIPNGWTESITGQKGIGDPTFGSKIIYPVTQGGQTCIKVLAFGAYPYTGAFGGGDREMNSAWANVKPGDTVVFSAWIWTDASTIGDNNPSHGVEIGMDSYSSGGRLCQINNKNGVGTPTYNGASYDYAMDILGWGSGTWIHMSMTWVVPNSVYYDGFGTASNVFGQAYQPSAIIPWIGAGSSNPGHEGAAMYFCDTELYINP
jgi:hypothetical protein